jgi:hypothetical protein
MTAPQDARSPTPSQTQTPPGAQINDAIGNPMRGADGRTARLTLISALLGAMVGTLVTALPPTSSAFATTALTGDHLLIDLQVITILLFVFDFLSNFLTLLLAVTGIGWALSVSDYQAWLGWSAAVGVVALASLASLRFVRRVPIPWWRAALYVGTLFTEAYAACNAYGVLPGWATSSAPSLLWVTAIMALVAVDLGAFAVFLHAYRARFARPSR